MADEEMGHGCLFLFKVGGSRTDNKAYRSREMDQSLKVARAIIVSVNQRANKTRFGADPANHHHRTRL